MLLDGGVRHLAFSKDTAWIKNPFRLCEALVSALEDAKNENLMRRIDTDEQTTALIIKQAIQILKTSIRELERKLAADKALENGQVNQKLHSLSHSASLGSGPHQPECKQCQKSFTPFNRSRSCGCCGATFCTKCLWRRHLLPKSLGNHDNMVYVCNICIATLQSALDAQFKSCSSMPLDHHRAQQSRKASEDEDEVGEDDSRKSWLQSSMMRVGVHFRRIKLTTKNLLESENVSEDRSHEERQKRPSSDDANSIESELHEETDDAEEKRDDDVNSVDINSILGSLSDEETELTSRKNLRSASLDCTTLHPKASIASRSDENRISGRLSLMIRSETTGRCVPKVSARSYDDSCIVRGERKPTPILSGHSILRFGVLQVHSRSESRRSLRFASKPFASSRCTLELDRDFGQISVRSVFIHRIWSFRCDDIQSIQDVEGRELTATVRIIILDDLFKSRRKVDFQFDHDQEKEAFKYAVASYCAEKSVKLLTRVSETSQATNRKSIIDDFETNLSMPNVRRASSQMQSLQRSNHWIAGEIDAARAEAMLVTGPIGEVSDVSPLWGRVAGNVYVTNYRVLFIPSERSYVPIYRSCDNAAAYVPFFDITSVNVVSRVKPFRSASTGMAPFAGTTPPVMYAINQASTVLCISCKDVRIMQLVVVAPIDSVEETTRKLLKLIQARANASQKYQTIPRDMAITTRERLRLEALSKRNEECTTTIPNVDTEPGFSSSMSEAAISFDLTHFDATEKCLEVSGAFAFAYAPRRLPWEKNGWDLFREEEEYKRQFGDQKEALAFLKLFQNSSGSICRTYPSKLLLPASMSLSKVVEVASFRAKNRLPVVTYYHRRQRCVLARSGQPLLGNLLAGTSSLSDQLLIGFYRRLPEIIANQSTSSPSTRPIYIFDARKFKASTGNRLLGKGGVETAQDYPGAVIYHLNIANIYRMQSSYLALMKLLLPGEVPDDDRTWLTSVESTGWLNYIRLILEGAVRIARALEIEGSSVLVHCSDGWDRTSQLSSLAQLLIDPYYRTIEGFAVLIEKDWCAFGHKFAERTGGNRNCDLNRNKSSPILLQFLDAVWQVYRQFPYAFQFTEQLLLWIANSIYSGQFGTFLYNNRLEREHNCVYQWTVSLWTPVFRHFEKYENAEYTMIDKPIWPWTGPQMIQLWEGYFLQWHPKYHNCRWISTSIHHDHEPEEQPTEPDTISSTSKPSPQAQDTWSCSPNGASAMQESDLTASSSSKLKDLKSAMPNDRPPPMRNIFLYKN
uniref:phosphatidylinositol-3,5-bisphosphate 3-phosphatase n=1 Tax=Albugo laibachii Nc14 TaxID=890382 RepID=F0W1U2_9STRA|nr:myotubularinlike protein putative [Albugo laibachii Nc14]CCA23174.1 myotubularinlike protein putative [Albugo laibachii Nc14]|eukprot:CCA23174.1 myotubularinlike protein putative [Albugo laibachii Nc14]